MPAAEKPLIWLGSSYRDLMSMPEPVRHFFGLALGRAQQGERHESAKVLRGFGGAGVLEIIKDEAGGTFRAVYTVRFQAAVFVLHVFQKKSRRGVETPNEDVALIRARLKIAEVYSRRE
ncbi:MAG TPA: type II toxin-antitoxin system RelE/ParE family toxin [Zeimonas sp.]|nr:type II toxin-antitoxin system RelE/ParE family toxin [Zeimonas sp.]